MKYFVRGKGPVNITNGNFISEGGEGQIFGMGNTIYKIFFSSSKMIPIAKFDELQVLDNPRIVKPDEIILKDKSKKEIGFTMRWIKDSIPLCKVFTTSFRKRNGITIKDTTKLISNMQEAISFIHSNNCILVDGNEMNILVDERSFQNPFFIDINSFQTKSFPATVIMPTIRDWHTKNFTELTDWFSFAIIACQLLVGIHPYKGKHPDFKKADLEARMKKNISIFNKDVRVPTSTRDFNDIPSEFLEWFINLFEKGKRLNPPILGAPKLPIASKLRVIKTTDKFDIKKLFKYDSEILSHYYINGKRVVITKDSIFIDKNKVSDNNGEKILFTTKYMTPIIAYLNDENLLEVKNILTKDKILCSISGQNIFTVLNRLYVKNEGNLLEIDFQEFSSKILSVVKHTWNIMPNASQIFEGVIVQNILGKCYLSIPTPSLSGSSKVNEIAFNVLDGYRIIDGKNQNGVCILTANRGHKYIRTLIKFHDNMSWDCKKRDISSIESVNFTCLENGVVIIIDDEDNLKIFNSKRSTIQMTEFKDPAISSDMTLSNEGTKVIFYRDKDLYQISMKN